MTTQADSAQALGMPPDGVESTVTGGDPETSYLAPVREHVLHIRVYDYCREHGYHTDPELPGNEAGL